MSVSRLRVDFHDGTFRVFDNATATHAVYDGNEYLEIKQGDAIVADYLKREVFDARPILGKVKARAHTG